MTQQTSREAWEWVKCQKWHTKMRGMIYQTLYFHGPLTQKQTFNILNNSFGTSLQERSINSEFAKMQRKALIRCRGTVICEHTHRKVTEWEVTGEIETPSVRVKSEKALLKEKVAELEKEISRLKRELKQQTLF